VPGTLPLIAHYSQTVLMTLAYLHSMSITIKPIFGKQIATVCANVMREDHWLHRYQWPGRWQGLGARHFRLWSSVRKPALKAVLQGLTPDGKVRLADDAKNPARRSGWIVQFDSPPTLNALYAVAQSKVARHIEQSHEKAVKPRSLNWNRM